MVFANVHIRLSKQRAYRSVTPRSSSLVWLRQTIAPPPLFNAQQTCVLLKLESVAKARAFKDPSLANQIPRPERMDSICRNHDICILWDNRVHALANQIA